MSEFQKKDIALIEIEIVAKTGQLNVEWNEYRKLLTSQICLVLDSYFRKKGFLGPVTQTFDGKKEEILALLDEHSTYPPFTIQRISEVVYNPESQFKTTHGLINSLIKLLSVFTPSLDYPMR